MKITHAALILFSTSMVWSLKLRGVVVPDHKRVGENARLFCHYDLEQDSLYSVKWYKGGREFFRFVPRDDPPAQAFALDAVTVNISQSNRHQVLLMNVGLSSSGRYKCEVSADAPHFQTSSAIGEMNVIAVPETGPEIKGLKSFYRPGDTLQVNCTSRNSKPAASLAWYVNNQKQANFETPVLSHFKDEEKKTREANMVDNDNLIEYAPKVEQGGLETSVLGLKLYLKTRLVESSVAKNRSTSGKSKETKQNQEANDWRRGQVVLADGLILNCTAAIGSSYWTSTSALAKPEEISSSQKLMESRPAAAKSDGAAVTNRTTGSFLSVLAASWVLLYFK